MTKSELAKFERRHAWKREWRRANPMTEEERAQRQLLFQSANDPNLANNPHLRRALNLGPVARVYNKKHDHPKGCVYVGRPSKWGNPFVVGKDGTREQVIEKYRVWIGHRIENGEVDIEELRGQDLLCWCAPLPCHGDVLVELANRWEAR